MTAHATLQLIPTVRHTQAELLAAELEVIAAFKEFHGPQHEPGLLWVRESALALLADKERAR